jgi:hypothetical protein
MSAKTSPLLFVDTNILLDFYRMRGEAGFKLLRRLSSAKVALIATFQVEMEFKKNRQRVLAEFIEALKKLTGPLKSPALVEDAYASKSLDESLDRVRKDAETLRGHLISLIAEPEKDPVFECANSLFRNATTLNLATSSPELSGQNCRGAC